MGKISTTLKAGTLVVGVALAGLPPAAAQAGDGDAVRIIGGLVALGLIAKALDDDDRPQAAPYGHAQRPVYRGQQAQHRQWQAERAYQRQLEADRAYQRQLQADRRAERAYQRQIEQQRQARQAERAYQRQLEQDRLARQQRHVERRDDRFPRQPYARPYVNETDRLAQRRGFPPGSIISPNH